MLKEIRIAGFGGQGVILSAHILGRAAAIHESGYATMTQNYGPEARGGRREYLFFCRVAAFLLYFSSWMF